jgi:hypothetical protein
MECTMKKATKKTTATSVPDDRMDAITRAFAKYPDVSLGKMFGSAGLKVKGKVFAMAVKGRLVAKLPKARVDELVGARRGEHFDPGHGKLMREWISVPSGEADWLSLAREAHRFVKGPAK